jgi:hypothetical protein
MRFVRLIPVVALGVAAACASDNTGPISNVDGLVDESATAAYSSSAMAASVGGSVMPMVPTGTSSCAFSKTNQRFECAPVTRDGITVTRSFALLDASGASLSVAGPTAIASIHTISTMSGTLASSRLSGLSTAATMTIDRHEDATLSQLQSPTHVLNGTSTQVTDFVTTGLTVHTDETSTTSNLRLPGPAADVRWPLGGTITTDRTLTGNGLPSQPTREVIAFDGTSIMTVTRTTGGFTSTCRIDLAKPGVPMCG